MPKITFQHPWKSIRVAIVDAHKYGIKVGPAGLVAKRTEDETVFRYDRKDSSLPDRREDWKVVGSTYGERMK